MKPHILTAQDNDGVIGIVNAFIIYGVVGVIIYFAHLLYRWIAIGPKHLWHMNIFGIIVLVFLVIGIPAMELATRAWFRYQQRKRWHL